MDREALERQTRRELVQLAREYGIRGRTTMRKHELIMSLLESGDAPPPPANPVQTGARMPSSGAPATESTEAPGAVAVMEDDRTPSSPVHEYPDITTQPVLPPPCLPRGYGDNRIVLMARDSYWMFAYWEIQQYRVDQAQSFLGDAWDSSSWILRVHDVTDIVFDGTNSHSFFDIEIAAAADNWYIEVPADDRSYLAEIGVRATNGRFFVLARSNAVETPRAGLSDVIDEAWMSREREFERLYAMAGGGGTSSASLGLRELMEQRLRALVASGGVSSFGGSALR